MNRPAAYDRSEDERLVRTVERDYDAAWTAGDIDRLLTLLTPDAVIVNPYGGVARGTAEIETMLRGVRDTDDPSSTHTSVVTAVYFVTDDVALADGEATIERIVLPGQAAPGTYSHSYTDVLVRRDGVWRIAQIRAYTHAG
jgi:uncharacterized protein (TIGR02246 family)